jgi:glycosyltransferase involved in cell wall biosynthesis
MKKFTNEEIKKSVSEPLFDEKNILKKDNSFPKISIVTPSLNQDQFLEKTILSVLNQNYPNLEYIIIDGGSTDGSVDIIKKYKKYIDYWVSEPDEGQSEALNKGFKLCTGEIVGWQNSDDTYLPGSFEIAANMFSEDIDVIYGNIKHIDEEDRVIRNHCFLPVSRITVIYESLFAANQGAFFNRKAFEKYGFLDESLHYAMDCEFFLRLFLQKAKFKYTNNFIGAFRIQSESKSKGNNIPKWDAEYKYIDRKLHVNRSKYQSYYKKLSLFRRAILYLFYGNVGYFITGFRKRVL